MVVDSWRLAVGTLTRWPVSPPRIVDSQRAGLAALLAPLAVLPLGLSAGLLIVGTDWLGVPPSLTAVGVVAVSAWWSRGLHFDGVGDVADGLAASYQAEESLEVMRSGTVGPAGVVMLLIVVSLQIFAVAALLVRLSPGWAGLCIAVALCAARAAVALAGLRGIPAARDDGLGHLFADSVPALLAAAIWILTMVATSAATAAAGLGWAIGGAAIVVGLVTVYVLVALANRRFGGVTGDVMGAGVELMAATILIVLTLH